LIAFTLLAACATPDELGPVAGPSVALVNSAGISVGAVQAEQRPGGTYLRIAVQGLTPGEHGLHLHGVGRCDGPDFKSAGPHWKSGGHAAWPLPFAGRAERGVTRRLDVVDRGRLGRIADDAGDPAGHTGALFLACRVIHAELVAPAA
jgi:hypothetical protein